MYFFVTTRSNNIVSMDLKKFYILTKNDQQMETEEEPILFNMDHIVSIKPIKMVYAMCFLTDKRPSMILRLVNSTIRTRVPSQRIETRSIGEISPAVILAKIAFNPQQKVVKINRKYA